MTLDQLLAGWATQQRLSPSEAAAVRRAAIQAESSADDERLWDLLRPVTALLEGPRGLHSQLTRAFPQLA